MRDSPDPVNEPQHYQEHLLDLLSDDDPAEVQSETAARMRRLVADAGDLLRAIPQPGEWSVLGCLAHVVDAEIVMSGRYRWVLAHDQPPLFGYDQDLWVERLHSPAETAEELFALFEPLRLANITLWRRSSQVERSRIGLHSERGPESYDLCFRMIAGHDRFHMNQARKTLAILESPS